MNDLKEVCMTILQSDVMAKVTQRFNTYYKTVLSHKTKTSVNPQRNELVNSTCKMLGRERRVMAIIRPCSASEGLTLQKSSILSRRIWEKFLRFI